MNIHDFNQPGKASVLLGGSFGSEGKGLAAAYVALNSPPDIAVTNAAPNAGHTTVMADGTSFVTFHLPTAGVICPDSIIYLDAGAVIDIDMLFKELETIDATMGTDTRSRLRIHPRATVITQDDKDFERNASSGAAKIASTQKGCGRSVARKLMRDQRLAKDYPELAGFIQEVNLAHSLKVGHSVMIEVPQGFSLSINHGASYPHCTFRDSTVMTALNDAGVNPHFLGNVMMCFRTYPIRVGNLVVDGKEVGFSGPCYPDQKEIQFEDIGQKAEFTTVTKRKRRIFTFSKDQYQAAMEVNRANFAFLNFVNYLQDPAQLEEIRQKMTEVEEDVMGTTNKVTHVFGLGPKTTDVCIETDEGETPISLNQRMGWPL